MSCCGNNKSNIEDLECKIILLIGEVRRLRDENQVIRGENEKVNEYNKKLNKKLKSYGELLTADREKTIKYIISSGGDINNPRDVLELANKFIKKSHR